MNRAIGKCAILVFKTYRTPRNPQNFIVFFFYSPFVCTYIVMRGFPDLLHVVQEIPKGVEVVLVVV